MAAYSYIPNAQRQHYLPASLPGLRLPADRSATRSRRHLFLQPNSPQVWLEVRTCCPIIVTMYNARHCGALAYYWVVRIPKAGGRSLPSGGSLIRWRIRSSIHPPLSSSRITGKSFLKHKFIYTTQAMAWLSSASSSSRSFLITPSLHAFSFLHPSSRWRPIRD